MALRSVIVEAPAAPPPSRRTVVVRAGGPAPKGRMLDVVIGIVGVILLVAAVGLSWYLPDRTYLNPQFRLSFTESNGEFGGSLEAVIQEGATHDFEVDVPADNVKAIRLIVGFPEDDVRYSISDNFQVDLIAPNGTQVGAHLMVRNAEPRAGQGAADPPVTEGGEGEAVFTTVPARQEQIVTGLSHTENEAQALARLEPQYRVATAGKWVVRVTLQSAGDCPSPGSEAFPSQAYYCRFGTPNDQAAGSQDGSDNENLFLLAGFTYTYYQTTVQELK